MKGSPGGIALIGVGIVLLNVGYTGRYKEVWAALNGSSSGGAPSAPDPNANTGADGQSNGGTITPDTSTGNDAASSPDVAIAKSAACIVTATKHYDGVAFNHHPMCADMNQASIPQADGTCANSQPWVILKTGQKICFPMSAIKQPDAAVGG